MYRADIAFDRFARDCYDFERIFLPLAGDGRHVDKIIGVVDFLTAGTVGERLIA